MTICIAAISEGDKIIAVTDRMLTIKNQPETKYEITENNKIMSLDDKTLALFSGDVVNANQILNRIDLQGSTTLEDKAEKVRLAYLEYVKSVIDNALLTKYGFTRDTFMNNHRNLDQNLVSTLTSELMKFGLDVWIIIAGIDAKPHLYLIDISGNKTLLDSIGYAMIGSGSTHARLSLIESRYNSNLKLEQSIYALLEAKKRAEFDPGVGTMTDIAIINPNVKKLETKKIDEIVQLFKKSNTNISSIKKSFSLKIKKLLQT